MVRRRVDKSASLLMASKMRYMRSLTVPTTGICTRWKEKLTRTRKRSGAHYCARIGGSTATIAKASMCWRSSTRAVIGEEKANPRKANPWLGA